MYLGRGTAACREFLVPSKPFTWAIDYTLRVLNLKYRKLYGVDWDLFILDTLGPKDQKDVLGLWCFARDILCNTGMYTLQELWSENKTN